MKAWQIFVVGTIAAVALFSFHAYESALAGIAALAIVAAVVVGFCLRPRKDVFYLRTTLHVLHRDCAVAVEHDQIAVRVELARLWLLFIPTFAAVAFLLVTSANGTTWKTRLLNFSIANWFNVGAYPGLLFFRFLIVAVFGLLTAWIGERWVLLVASACSAGSLRVSGKRVMYSFQDPSGGYYGGQGIPLGSTGSPQLRTIVLYRTSKPHLNRIAMCCLFHRLVIVGRGVTDLDEATAASMKAQPAAEML